LRFPFLQSSPPASRAGPPTGHNPFPSTLTSAPEFHVRYLEVFRPLSHSRPWPPTLPLLSFDLFLPRAPGLSAPGQSRSCFRWFSQDSPVFRLGIQALPYSSFSTPSFPLYLLLSACTLFPGTPLSSSLPFLVKMMLFFNLRRRFSPFLIKRLDSLLHPSYVHRSLDAHWFSPQSTFARLRMHEFFRNPFAPPVWVAHADNPPRLLLLGPAGLLVDRSLFCGSSLRAIKKNTPVLFFVSCLDLRVHSLPEFLIPFSPRDNS